MSDTRSNAAEPGCPMAGAAGAAGAELPDGFTNAPGQEGEVVAYRHMDDTGWVIEPAKARREWMDATTGRFAYRCLPLVMANQLGWIVRSPGTFSVKWGGKVGVDSLTITHKDGPESFRRAVLSHFGHGILSFMLPWIFRTPPGVALLVRGATNHDVHNAHALDGLVETDWISTSFTMNYRITAIGKEAWFRAGDPICMLTPIRVDAAEALTPRIADLSSNAKLEEELAVFNRKRAATAKASREKFEKGEKNFTVFELDYIHGKTPSGEESTGHRTNIKLKPFGSGT